MSKKIVWLLCALMVLISACGERQELEESSGTESVGQAQTEGEREVVRWGIIDSDDNIVMEQARIEKVNALLKERGYTFSVDIQYMTKEEENLDILTFPVAGVGEEEMQERLLALEPYFEEGEALYEAAAFWPEQSWRYNQVGGHNYNFGRLIDVIYPGFSLGAVGDEAEKQYEVIREDLVTMLEENEMQGVPEAAELFMPLHLAFPYLQAWDDELGVQCQFHMIAPGVGLCMEGGTEFENIWESALMQQLLTREEEWLLTGVSSTYVEDYYPGAFMRGVYRKQSFSEAEKETGQYIYLEEEGVMVPTLNQCYTSILKESSHIEESLELLAAVNTDAELAEALREPLAPTEGGKMTRNFYEVCNGLFLQERDCEQAVEERLEQAENGQISPILGFTFDARPVEEEVEALWRIMEEGAIGTVNEAVLKAQEQGSELAPAALEAWRAEIENMKQALEAAGIDAVIAEANRQLAAWQEEMK